MIINGKKCTIEHIITDRDDTNGWILREYLTKEEQIQIYSDMITRSEKSGSHENINKVSPNTMFPITYWNLAYVNEPNNCEYPKELIDMAQNIWNNVNGKLNNLPFIDLPHFNSAVAQLYGVDSVLQDHYDKGVTYGLSISLGSSCKFNFDKQTIILNSGDILITDFSKVYHGIPLIIDNPPGWFTDGIYTLDDKQVPINTFGRTRMSIQIKYVDKNNCPEPIPLDKFYNTLESYNK